MQVSSVNPGAAAIFEQVAKITDVLAQHIDAANASVVRYSTEAVVIKKGVFHTSALVNKNVLADLAKTAPAQAQDALLAASVLNTTIQNADIPFATRSGLANALAGVDAVISNLTTRAQEIETANGAYIAAFATDYSGSAEKLGKQLGKNARQVFSYSEGQAVRHKAMYSMRSFSEEGAGRAIAEMRRATTHMEAGMPAAAELEQRLASELASADVSLKRVREVASPDRAKPNVFEQTIVAPSASHLDPVEARVASAVDSTPASVADVAPETASAPAADVAPAPVADVAPAPVADVVPAPVADVAPAPTPEAAPASASAPEVAPEPAAEVAPASVPEVEAAPVPEPVVDMSWMDNIVMPTPRVRPSAAVDDAILERAMAVMNRT